MLFKETVRRFGWGFGAVCRAERKSVNWVSMVKIAHPMGMQI
jgi:hypothetical protein